MAAKYTDKEIEFIVENYGKVGTLEIARKLERSCSAIKQVARRHGLSKARNNLKPKPSKTRRQNKIKHEHSDVCSRFFSILHNVYSEHKNEATVEDIVGGVMAFVRDENGGRTHTGEERIGIYHQA
jgi:hypothetical protein